MRVLSPVTHALVDLAACDVRPVDESGDGDAYARPFGTDHWFAVHVPTGRTYRLPGGGPPAAEAEPPALLAEAVGRAFSGPADARLKALFLFGRSAPALAAAARAGMTPVPPAARRPPLPEAARASAFRRAATRTLEGAAAARAPVVCDATAAAEADVDAAAHRLRAAGYDCHAVAVGAAAPAYAARLFPGRVRHARPDRAADAVREALSLPRTNAAGRAYLAAARAARPSLADAFLPPAAAVTRRQRPAPGFVRRDGPRPPIVQSTMVGEAVEESVDKAVALYGPVIATAKQKGYVLRVHDARPEDPHGKPAHVDSPDRSVTHAGTQTVERLKTGEVVKAGGWMDWAERHYPENYKEMSKADRAALEAEEQKRYGYANTFAFHKARDGVVGGRPPTEAEYVAAEARRMRRLRRGRRDEAVDARPPRTAEDVKTFAHLQAFAAPVDPSAAPPGHAAYTHATRSAAETRAIARDGIRPGGDNGRVYASKAPLVRDRGGGHVVFHAPVADAKVGRDRTDAFDHEEHVFRRPIAPHEVVRVVEPVRYNAGGHSIDADKLAAYAVAHQGEHHPELPHPYRGWFHLERRADEAAVPPDPDRRRKPVPAHGPFHRWASRVDPHAEAPGWDVPPNTHWSRLAYGGVVHDGRGRVLLRKPTNGYGGYSFTFPKGRKDDEAEHPAAVAAREVGEETGFADPEITGFVPGAHGGTTSTSYFYLMKPRGRRDRSKMDAETEAVAWATPERAAALIGGTPSPHGRDRDLSVLQAAAAALGRPLSPGAVAKARLGPPAPAAPSWADRVPAMVAPPDRGGRP